MLCNKPKSNTYFPELIKIKLSLFCEWIVQMESYNISKLYFRKSGTWYILLLIIFVEWVSVYRLLMKLSRRHKWSVFAPSRQIFEEIKFTAIVLFAVHYTDQQATRPPSIATEASKPTSLLLCPQIAYLLWLPAGRPLRSPGEARKWRIFTYICTGLNVALINILFYYYYRREFA